MNPKATIIEFNLGGGHIIITDQPSNTSMITFTVYRIGAPAAPNCVLFYRKKTYLSN